MSKGNGPLDFEATLDAAKLNYMLDEIERRIKGTANTAVREADKMDKAFNKVGLMAGGYFTAAFGAKMIGDLVSVRGEFQQLGIAFETILKNKEKSDALMQDITQFAAKTPFDLKQVATGAKQLLAYGEASEDVIGTMRKLGDIASGLSIPFGDLVYLYGTSRTQGKLMTKDLMQFAGRGIPIIEELSKVLGVSKARVLEMASESKIGFEQLDQVINNLTSSTGMFGGMMEKQAKSLPGLISNLGDAWDRMLNKIGTNSQDTFADAITLAIDVVDNYQKVIEILKVIVATYGTYRAAVILNSIAVNGYSKALGLAIIKEKLLALAKKATPWGLALTGLTAVIGALVIYRNSLSDTSEKLEEFNKSTNSAVAESNVLFEELKKTAAGTDERRAAVFKLNNIHGEYLKNLNLEKATLVEIEAAQRGANDELVRKMTLEAKNKDLQVWFEKEIEIRKAVAKAGYDFDKILEESKVKTSKNGNPLFTSFGNEIDQLLMNYYVVQEEKKKIEDLYDKAYKSVTTSTKKETITPDPLPDKKTFEDKLQEIKKQYENYYKWVEHYGKESADKQFSELIKSGDSYLEYLNGQISKLEGKKRTPVENKNLVTLLSSKDEETAVKSRMETLQEEVENAKDQHKKLSDYIIYLDDKIAENRKSDDGSEQSLQMLLYLQEQRKEAEKDYIKQSQDTFDQLLEQSKDFSDRRTQIEKDYQETIQKLDKNSLGEKKYNDAVKIAQEKRDDDLKQITFEEIQLSEAYKKLTEDIDNLSRSAIKRYTNELEKQLALLDKQDKGYDDIKNAIDQAKKSLKTIDSKMIDNISEGFSAVAGMVDDFNKQLAASLDLTSNLAGAIGKIASGDIFGGIMSGITGLWNYISNIGARREAEDEEQDRLRMEMLNRYVDKLNDSLELQRKLIEDLVGAEKLKQYGDSFLTIAANVNSVTQKLKELDVTFRHTGGAGSGNGRGSGNRYSTGKLNLSDIDLNLAGITSTYDKISKIQTALGTLNSDIISIRKQLVSGAIADSEELSLLLEQYENAADELQNMQNAFFAEVTGTSYESILDGIISAFEDGLSSAEYFAQNFEEMMRQALLQALSINSLQKPIQDWYTQFAAFSEDGLSKDEIAQLRASLEQIYANAEEQAKLIEDASGMGLSASKDSEDKLASAVKGVNQETASLIAGQMNAIRINQAQSLSIMNKKLEVLSRIDNNTLTSARFAKLIYEFMQTYPKNNSLPSTRIEG